MTLEYYTIILLVIVVVVQWLFFMWQINKLVNKLMSRDLFSYVQATKKPEPLKGFEINIDDPEIDRVKELNSSLGFKI